MIEIHGFSWEYLPFSVTFFVHHRSRDIFVLRLGVVIVSVRKANQCIIKGCLAHSILSQEDNRATIEEEGASCNLRDSCLLLLADPR